MHDVVVLQVIVIFLSYTFSIVKKLILDPWGLQTHNAVQFNTANLNYSNKKI